MRHNLYRKPNLPFHWERDKALRNEWPVVYARDEQHAEQLQKRMKRKVVRIVIDSEKYQY